MSSPPETQQNSTALFILQDSGPPQGSTDYTTIVLLHGFAWHSGIFSKLVPFAPQHNARIVLVNRRDYPGAAPFSPTERSVLDSLTKEPDAATMRAQLEPLMRECAHDLVDLLERFIQEHNIPASQRDHNKGGIVLLGWSFGTVWMTAFLAHAPSLHAGKVNLVNYLRRVVLLDPPYLVLGFSSPADPYNPLFDPTVAPEDRAGVFAKWISGYFNHHTDINRDIIEGGPTTNLESFAEALERRTYLTEPPPTLSTLTPDEVASALYPKPGSPGGSDSNLLAAGIQSEMFSTLRRQAFAAPQDERWRAVEVRHVWCDRSVWETTWTACQLRHSFEEGRKEAQNMRKVTWIILEGSNHFVHWDEPERTLIAILTNDVTTY